VSSTTVKKVDSLNVRFIQVMEALGYTGYSFSRKLSTSEAVISNVRLGKNPPNILLIRDLLKEHEDVDPGWLLTGKGQMFRRMGQGEPSEPALAEMTAALDRRFDEVVKLLKRSIAAQVERNAMVDESISTLESQVEGLHKSLATVRKGHRKEG
jgi:transcriptional regulator with XRE-family HTH domain